MEMYLILINCGVERGIEYHCGCGGVVLLVVIWCVVVVVIVRVGGRIGAPVVWVVSAVVGIAGAGADHRVQLGFGTVQHGRRRCQGCIDELVVSRGLRQHWKEKKLTF